MCTAVGFVVTGAVPIREILDRWGYKENHNGIYCSSRDLSMFSEGMVDENSSFSISSNRSGCSCGIFDSYDDEYGHGPEIMLIPEAKQDLKELIEFMITLRAKEIRLGNTDRYYDIAIQNVSREELLQIIQNGILEEETVYQLVLD